MSIGQPRDDKGRWTSGGGPRGALRMKTSGENKKELKAALKIRKFFEGSGRKFGRGDKSNKVPRRLNRQKHAASLARRAAYRDRQIAPPGDSEHAGY